MRIALFGGSFNPPHIAHVMVALWTVSTQAVDQVWWVPTHRHAFGKELVDFDLRCQMTERAAAPLGTLAVVSRVEQELGKESRTIDTVRHLMAQRPDDEFSLVIGADILLESHKWKQFDQLQKLCKFHVIGRTGVTVPGRTFDVTLPYLSSTEMREHLAQNDMAFCRPRLPRTVLQLILQHQLYGVSLPLSALDEAP